MAAVSPYFGCYATDNLIIPLIINRFEADFNAGAVLYSIARNSEYI